MELHHLAFRTHQLAAVVRFYRELLGLTVVRERPGRSVWLALGQAVLMLEQAAPSEPAIPKGTRELVALKVDGPGRQAVRERLAAVGIAPEHQTEYTTYFRDPDGRRVAVSEYRF